MAHRVDPASSVLPFSTKEVNHRQNKKLTYIYNYNKSKSLFGQIVNALFCAHFRRTGKTAGGVIPDAKATSSKEATIVEYAFSILF